MLSLFGDAEQVRLVIWKCKDVVSADLLSGLNDLFVKAWIEGCDHQVLLILDTRKIVYVVNTWRRSGIPPRQHTARAGTVDSKGGYSTPNCEIGSSLDLV